MNAFQREGNILLRRQVGVEIKLLKNEADPAAQLAQGAAGKLARRFAVDRSSPNTPAVFFAASFPMTEISSSNVAISSNKVNRLLPAKIAFLHL